MSLGIITVNALAKVNDYLTNVSKVGESDKLESL
jgi:hypothetical protein